ncbi:ABC transporter ATP-binding protein [Enterovirga rhinocerotis]|uniref:ATP-binding cassette subfamily B multidrug efflux pump n=1 Tax=Enterovirga rhinocerotis TaxID=1339210 RepID=A0A4R7BRV5_9HYPH|nr:ABC transporter ATP-binding protein [Enterovirga rhinocerotis]TDR88121.1 ATP-binding cassette subfamily B multidrug efflux pump [Enterovirga rhinocerotis]
MFRRLESLIDPFAPFSDSEMPPTSVARFMWHYLRPVLGWLGVLLAISVVTGIVESSLYLLVGWFVDLLARSSPETILADHGHLLLLAALLIAVVRPLLQSLDELVQNQIIVPQTTNLIRWRTHLYTLRHSVGYFQGDFAGRLANRIVQAGPAIREIAVTLLDTLVYVLIFAVTALALFGSISLWLALPMALWIAGYGALMWYFVPRAQTRSLANSESRSLMVGRVVDSYTNILTVKLFARTDDERSSVRDALDQWLRSFLDLMRLITGVTAALAFMNSALLVATATLSLRLWMNGQMTPGEIAAGLALVMRVITMSGWVMHTVRGVFENIGVVQESMATIARPHAVVDAPGAPDLAVTEGAIRFDRATFNYGRETGVITDLDLAIRPGEKVGLVGPSGAGKTTTTSLLLRLHDLEGGRITIDGQDIAGVTQDSLRRQIAVVTQDTSLLHRSIRENISYGRMGASDAEIERATRLAHADGFIADLVDHKGRRRLDAHVGERGVKLSGGQRQRIAIARVILKDAPILVLDEATSALDSEIEAAIQEALSTLMEGKTVLAIAHRLSTIAALDRLVVMDHGRIVEQGSHGELLAKGGLYARLWHRQSGGFLGEKEAQAAE